MSSRDRDRTLHARLVAGDEHALRETYTQHAAAVHGLALRTLRDAALAEDVVQDVFVRLWQAPDRYDPERGALRSFLLAMAHSRAVERVRVEDGQRRRSEREAREPAPVVDGPEGASIEDAVAGAVRDAVRALPAAERTAIELAYFGGLSYRDVARRLGEPEGTVKYRIRSGMHRLRAALRAVEVAP